MKLVQDTFSGKCLRKPLQQGLLSHHGVKEKHQPLYQKLVLNMVEVRGVEPLSENPANQASPSAVHVLTFPLPHARGQAYGFSSFIKSGLPQSLGKFVPRINDAG